MVQGQVVVVVGEGDVARVGKLNLEKQQGQSVKVALNFVWPELIGRGVVGVQSVMHDLLANNANVWRDELDERARLCSDVCNSNQSESCDSRLASNLLLGFGRIMKLNVQRTKVYS